MENEFARGYLKSWAMLGCVCMIDRGIGGVYIQQCCKKGAEDVWGILAAKIDQELGEELADV